MGAIEDNRSDEQLRRLDARFRRPLMSFFLRRVGNRAEAEDLTQDTFIRLVGSFERGTIEDVDAFVFKVAGNLLKDRQRSFTARAGTKLLEIDTHLVSTLTREFLEDRDPERVLISRLEISEVFKALSELGELTKDIYVLFRLEAMKQKEIAALYGLTTKSVEKHVMRATAHLTLKFGGYS